MGEDIERLLTGDPPLTLEAWRRMRGWNRVTVDHALPPARVKIERITAECVELYRSVPPLGENIPPSVTPTHINTSVPTEEEVEWAVQRLQGHKLGGQSWMRVENLRDWLLEHLSGDVEREEAMTAADSNLEEWERRDEDRGEDGEEEWEQTKWERMMELVQTDFRYDDLAEEATWQAVVLILKGGRDYRSRGIVEVVWKAVAVILNHCFTALPP